MKKLFIILSIIAIAISATGEETLNIREWVSKLDWKKPNKTGIKTIDDVYEMSDKLYSTIKEMGDSVPMYSLRSIVENGDTVAIVVVDQFNKPYDGLSAASQMVSGGAYLTSITAEAVSLSARYASLIVDLPNIVKSKGLGSIRIINDVTKTSKKVGKITKEFLPQVKEAYNKSGNPIKAYCAAKASMSADDGFVTTGFDHVPEFGPDDMPTDEELDLLLEQERGSNSIL